MPSTSARIIATVYASAPVAQPADQMRSWRPLSSSSTIRGMTSRCDVLPHGRVAEEAGDVDQDRVEERGELVGLALEILAIGGVAVDADLVHALLEAPDQRRPLVPRVVEAALSRTILEQRLELGIGGSSRRDEAGDRLARQPVDERGNLGERRDVRGGLGGDRVRGIAG